MVKRLQREKLQESIRARNLAEAIFNYGTTNNNIGDESYDG